MAASEVAVGLALVLQLSREKQSLDLDSVDEMKG
jgi:NADH:ubiquinone oxidoreductase subunit K